MASATSLTAAVRRLDVESVRAGLAERPDLVGHRDRRGRTWLHLACGLEGAGAPTVELADLLLGLGLGIDDPAFTEDDGTWHATPLWFAIARGRNLALARHLLDRGCSPEHCLWAASFADDLDAIDLLVQHGATVDAVFEGYTPFLEAVATSHFTAAERLLRHGADPDVRDPKGDTALHLMLRKRSDPAHLRTAIEHGARTDLPGADGRTAAEVIATRRSPELRALLG